MQEEDEGVVGLPASRIARANAFTAFTDGAPGVA